MKTIFLTSFHSFISRNILRTEILPILKASGLRIVILVPKNKTDYFAGNFKEEGVEIEGIDPVGSFLDNIIYFISVCLVSIDNLFIRSLREKKRYIRFFTAFFIHFFFSKFFPAKTAVRYFYNHFMVADAFGEFFRKYKPALIFSTDIYHVPDRILVAEAKKRGVFTIGMVRSWDNVTTKGVMLAIPDKIISPSEIIRNELEEYNRISEDKIFVSGIPHYDDCVRQPSVSKEQFFARMGLNLDKKVILFAPAGALLYKYDGEILKTLQRLKNEGRFKSQVQFLVRFHPGSKSNMNGFTSDEDFIFDEPGLDLVGAKKQSELTREDAEQLNASLFYSDIVMTVASSIAIDGAVFDKPTVIFSFNTVKSSDDDIKKFVRNFHLHFKKFISFHLCGVANSENELVEYIHKFLEDSTLDHEKRMEIVRRYCYKLDGNSSQRVAEFILHYV